MSEEAKTPDGDYVMMGHEDAAPTKRDIVSKLSVDDPNLSQEEKDHRLAIALQQQENAAVHTEYQKKHEKYIKAHTYRTARSGTFTKLAAVRAKDHGQFHVPPEYTSDDTYMKDRDYQAANHDNGFVPPSGASPQEIADAKLAYEIQKVEQIDAGTTQELNKIVQEESHEDASQARRTGRSTYGRPHTRR